MDLISLQEIRYRGQGIHNVKQGGYSLYYSGHDSKAEFGTGFLIRTELANNVMDFKAIDKRLSLVRLRGRFYNISILSVHAPTENKTNDEKESFYAKLDDILNSIPQNDAVVLMGDFNAQVGRNLSSDRFIGRYSLHAETNDNGQRLANFAISNGLVLASTYFQRKPCHQVTWVSPGGDTQTQIDHILVSARHFSSILKVRSFRGADIGSDHYLVGVRCRWKISKYLSTSLRKPRRFNIRKFKDPSIRHAYQETLDERIGANHSQPESANEQWNRLRSALTSTAETTVGFESNRPKKPWFDEECRIAVQTRKELHLRQLTRSSTAAFRQARKEAVRICRLKKREWWKREVEKIEQTGRQNNHRDFFRQVNFLKKGFQPRSSAIRSEEGDLQVEMNSILSTWAKYFDNLLNAGDPVSPSAEVSSSLDPPPDALPVEEPTFEEFLTSVRKLKSNKAPGIDGIPAELIIQGGDHFLKQLYRLMLTIWRTEQLPEEWKVAIVCPIHKKGDRLQCKNYRGISLLCCAYKIFSNILLVKMARYSEEIIGEYQCGFRPNRSTTDQTFALRMVLSKCWEYNRDIHQLFVDFRAAYDSIDRERLWSAMAWLGIPPKLVSLCRMTVAESQCRVRVERSLSESFHVSSGVRQGDGLSPVLFNLALEFVFRKASLPQDDYLLNKSLQVLAYADDICILGHNATTVQDCFSKLDEEGRKIGLQVNTDKTKYMVMAKETSGTDNLGEFERVESFKYLGSEVNPTNTIQSDIDSRIASGNRAFYSLKPFLKSPNLSQATKLNLYKTLIRPIVTFGSESWTLTMESERRLAVFERKVLRSIFGAIRLDDGSYRIRYNFELKELMRGPNIIGTIKSNRIRWLGHVLRSDDHRLIKRAYKGKVDWRRPSGRPRRVWRDEVWSDLRKLGRNVSNIEMTAQDRVQWRTIVEEAKSLHGT